MLVVTLPSSAARHPLRFVQKVQEMGAQVLEIRGDITPLVEPFNCPLPILVSPRGSMKLEVIAQLQPSYIDLEVDEEMPALKGPAIIRSYHHHELTPSFDKLKEIAETLIEQKGEIIKIATTIREYSDLITLDRLQKSLPNNQQNIILGMGDKAHLSRMTSPWRNAFTYTYLDGTDKAATGQLPLSVYRKMTINQEKKKGKSALPYMFGTIGAQQVTASLSPLIHNTLYSLHEYNGVFSIFPTQDFDEAWDALTQLGVNGFSITAPWKRKVIDRLSRLDFLADRLQSVNTAIKEGDEWVGYNTDMHGLIAGYPFLSECKRIAIIGSGGVVPAVIGACEDRNKGCRVEVFARNAAALAELADLHQIHTFPLDRLHAAEFDCVICTVTEDIPVVLPKTNWGHHAIDLRYGKKTKFLMTAADRGYICHDGLPMLIEQALKQFEIMTSISATQEDKERVEEVIKFKK